MAKLKQKLKTTNNNLQNITQKTKDRTTRTPLNTRIYGNVLRKGNQFLLHLRHLSCYSNIGYIFKAQLIKDLSCLQEAYGEIKTTNNDLQNSVQKTKYEATPTPLNTRICTKVPRKGNQSPLHQWHMRYAIYCQVTTYHRFVCLSADCCFSELTL